MSKGLNIVQRFSTDPSLEENGVWVDIGNGAEILVARTGNPNHKEYLQTKQRAAKIARGAGAEISDTELAEVLAATILLNWRGIVDEHGKEVKYTKEKAREYCTIKDFAALVMEVATNFEAFRVQVLTADADAAGKESAGS